MPVWHIPVYWQMWTEAKIEAETLEAARDIIAKHPPYPLPPQLSAKAHYLSGSLDIDVDKAWTD